MTAELPDDVTEVLAALLRADDPVHAALRRQLPRLRLRERCRCGCGTAYFDDIAGRAEPAPAGPGRVVAAQAQLVTEDGECPGEILVFAEDGFLSWLEVCSWSDDTSVTLADAWHLLAGGGGRER